MSINFPYKYIAIAEYNPISICLNTNTFAMTIIISIIVKYLLIVILGLYDFIKFAINSVPPVDAPTFKIIAVPIPIIAPPYTYAKNLSVVIGSILSNISIKTDKLAVPTIDFIKNFFPIL